LPEVIRCRLLEDRPALIQRGGYGQTDHRGLTVVRLVNLYFRFFINDNISQVQVHVLKSRSKSKQIRQPRFLPRDAMRKRGLCCHLVSVRPSVRLSRLWIVSRRLKISSNFFVGPVAPSFSFWPPAPIPNSNGNPFSGAQNTPEVGKFCDFRLKSLSRKRFETGTSYGTLIESHMCSIECDIFNDLDEPLTRFSRSWHFWSRISQNMDLQETHGDMS